MSPMDEFAWFQLPKITYVDIGNGTAKQLCTFDIYRVGLIIGLNSGGSGNAQMLISPDPSLTASTNHGIQIIPSSQPFQVLQREMGNLCQSEWWGTVIAAQPNVHVTVIEIRLKDWPRLEKDYASFKDLLRPDANGNFPQDYTAQLQAALAHALSAIGRLRNIDE